MWIDPLVKWRTADPSPAAAELLAGQAETALRLFREVGDPVGEGDALLALGRQREALERFEQAASNGDSDLIVECGLSQALVLKGDPHAAVQRMERVLAEHPDSPVVRHHLVGALLENADQVRSVTRDEDIVITSRAQIEACAGIVRRAAPLAVDDNHRAAVQRLADELANGEHWVWSDQAAALGYSALAAVVGLVVVGIGGAMGNVLLVVLGALAGAAGIYAVVIGYRRQAWQVRAADVAPMVWRHGVR